MQAPDRAHLRLYVAVRGDHRWAALLEDDRLVEFHREDERDRARVGDIYLGRIIRVDQGLGAAFVDIGRKQTAFLPLSEIPASAAEGAKTIVQIEREGLGEKAPRATARPVIAGPRLLLSPGRRAISLSERITDKVERTRLLALAKAIAEIGEGITMRTAAIGGNETQLRDEAKRLRAVWRELSGRQRSQQPPVLLERHLPIDLRLLRDLGWSFESAIYDHRGAAAAAEAWRAGAMPDLAPSIEFLSSAAWQPPPTEILERAERAVQSRIVLLSGGSILIESTQAMTVIDVNVESASRKHPSGRSGHVFLQTNLAAAQEIARQIRLRNVGGIVVVDFIDLKDAAARRQVVDRLRAATASDSAPVWVGTMSRLGLVELTRRRRGPTLSEMLTRECPTCEGAGRIVRADIGTSAVDAQ